MEEIIVAKKAATEAGKYLLQNFCKNNSMEFKTANDITVAEDKGSEQIILSIIKKKYPSHNIYSEEADAINNGSEYTWFIDPLDGTNNYAAGIPYFSVSIALLKGNEIILGVVYNPVSNQLFEATKKGGAFLNGNLLKNPDNKISQKFLCSFIQGHSVAQSENLSAEVKTVCEKLSTNCRRVISTWAPSLDWSLLAYGGIDVLVSFESETEDMYAGLLIAKEAGKKIVNFNGDKYQSGEKRIIAGNAFAVDGILALMD